MFIKCCKCICENKRTRILPVPIFCIIYLKNRDSAERDIDYVHILAFCLSIFILNNTVQKYFSAPGLSLRGFVTFKHKTSKTEKLKHVSC